MRYVCARRRRYDDQKLWHALEVSHLKEGIMKLEGKLDARVSEGGVCGRMGMEAVCEQLQAKTSALDSDSSCAWHARCCARPRRVLLGRC